MESGAQPGNANGTKLKDPGVRQLAYKEYCDWISLGNSKGSFYFEHQDLTCTWETLDKYIEDNPLEFPPIKMKVAKSKGYREWEGVVNDSARGVNKDASTASLQMKMRNQFGWDKEDRAKEDSAKEKMERMTKFVEAIDRLSLGDLANPS